DDTVTLVPTASPVAADCVGNADGTTPCQWFLDRYILYPQQSAALPFGASTYGLYDLQTHQIISSPLAQQVIQYTPVIRGPYIFFTPYGTTNILRYDSVTHAISTLIGSLPGDILDTTGKPAGGWSLSADTSSLFFISAQPAPPSCEAAIHCYAFYLR